MQLSQEDLKEFHAEAKELLEAAELALLAVDKGEPLDSHYDSIFRAFHSIKGAAGMMEMTELQSHMHKLESALTQSKGTASLSKETIDLFLRGCDATRSILAGKSVSFDYTVSAAPQLPAKASASPAPTPTPAPVSRLGKIYVIDDEPDITDFLTLILNEVGFETQGQTDPLKAIAEIPDFSPDVVLTDLSMPRMSGVQILEAVRKLDPDLPVIFVSGHVSKEALINSIHLGLHGVIEKPFKENDIVQVCMNASRQRRLSRLVNRSINLLLYQFSDLDRYLESAGKTEIRNILKTEIQTILALRKQLNDSRKKAA